VGLLKDQAAGLLLHSKDVLKGRIIDEVAAKMAVHLAVDGVYAKRVIALRSMGLCVLGATLERTTTHEDTRQAEVGLVVKAGGAGVAFAQLCTRHASVD